MELKAVEGSSNIVAYGYDQISKSLTIRFKGNTDYLYSDVPLEVVNGLEAAESKGSYIASKIRGKFTSRKLVPETPAE